MAIDVLEAAADLEAALRKTRIIIDKTRPLCTLYQLNTSTKSQLSKTAIAFEKQLKLALSTLNLADDELNPSK